MSETIETPSLEQTENGFNLTIEEVRILAKYRALSRHQQKGIIQAIDLIRPAVPQKPRRGSHLV
ncbi:MAG: hypothetical protein H6817_06415 [Phycisphaerales bacterium]|nr:hypothetical protein [Phycisphaerales bacterium]